MDSCTIMHTPLATDSSHQAVNVLNVDTLDAVIQFFSQLRPTKTTLRWCFVAPGCYSVLVWDENQLSQVDKLSDDYKRVFLNLGSHMLRDSNPQEHSQTDSSYTSVNRKRQFVSWNSEFTTDIVFILSGIYANNPSCKSLKCIFTSYKTFFNQLSTCRIHLRHTTVQTNK